ncbi:MAG: flagellar hook-basal body complex protein [Alphaproteobacteria bacterium]|nr:flagellar hook-basal body complex protein [Alphaproteobacteria bacterium]
MSLFGALFSGVSGLQSQSSAMGAIADNVTNVNTIGYKGTKVNFKTLITSQVSLTQYSPGGVQSAPKQSVDLQGLLQATTSATDLAISGSGFFVTNEAADPSVGDLYTFTRAGSFKVDKEGFLQNVGGSFMQGWPLSFFDGTASANQVTVGKDVFMKVYTSGSGGRVLINDNVIDNRNLRPLNLQTIGGTASPTTTIAVGANLPAEALVNAQERVNALIFDSLGNPHTLTYGFTKTSQNAWHNSLELPAQSAVVTQKTQNGEVHFAAGRIDFDGTFTSPFTSTINLTPNGNAFSYTVSAAGDDGSSNVDSTGRTLSQILDKLAEYMNASLVTVFGAAPSPPGNWTRRIPGENGITFDQGSDQGSFTFNATATDAAATPKQLIIQSGTFDTATGLPQTFTIPALDTTYGWYSQALASTGAPGLNAPSVEFAGNGTPNEFFNRTASQAPSPQHKVELIWANGAENMVNGNTKSPPIKVFMGNYNTPDGLTQLSGNFQLNYLQQNGAKFGNFAGVAVGADGIVTALFDNGVTRPVFMIPVATFTNPNGLDSLSGNVWIATDFSGNPTLREAGDAGAGQINAAALESSTVDLGEEFTRMITTQRAYSSAAKIITTADDMLDELLRIRR